MPTQMTILSKEDNGPWESSATWVGDHAIDGNAGTCFLSGPADGSGWIKLLVAQSLVTSIRGLNRRVGSPWCTFYKNIHTCCVLFLPLYICV